MKRAIIFFVPNNAGWSSLVARRAHKIKVMGSQISEKLNIAGWSSLVARRAHNPKVVGSNPAPATKNPLDGSLRDFTFYLLPFHYYLK